MNQTRKLPHFFRQKSKQNIPRSSGKMKSPCIIPIQSIWFVVVDGLPIVCKSFVSNISSIFLEIYFIFSNKTDLAHLKSPVGLTQEQ